MSVCNDVTILNLIYTFKRIIEFAKIIVPIILIILVMVDIVKTISTAEIDNKKLYKSVSKRIIAAVLVFLIPSILNLVLNAIPTTGSNPLMCYQSATKERIASIALNNADNSLTAYSTCVSAKGICDQEYDQASKDIKLIPDKKVRELRKQTLAKIKAGATYTKPTDVTPVIPVDNKCATVDYLGVPSNRETCGSKYTSQWVFNYVSQIRDEFMSPTRKKIAQTAALYAGVIPYSWGGKPKKVGNSYTWPESHTTSGVLYGPGLDCSGFINFVYGLVTGNTLGNSGTSNLWKNQTKEISKNELKVGDLGFQLNYDDGATENHVGIFVGKDTVTQKNIWIHAEGNRYNIVVIGDYDLFKYYRRVTTVDLEK